MNGTLELTALMVPKAGTSPVPLVRTPPGLRSFHVSGVLPGLRPVAHGSEALGVPRHPPVGGPRPRDTRRNCLSLSLSTGRNLSGHLLRGPPLPLAPCPPRRPPTCFPEPPSCLSSATAGFCGFQPRARLPHPALTAAEVPAKIGGL